MPSQTPNLDLYKVNGETDGNDTFNVDVVLNDNWDKIDAAVGGMEVEVESLKQSGVDGKNRLEAAVIAKEGTVSKQGQVATFEELDTGIRSIPTGTDTSDATAAAGDIISGKTAYGPSGKITGTIPDRGAGGIVTPGATDQTKAAGRYTSAITIKGVPVPADKVLAGTTIAGTPGTMPNRGAGPTITPSRGDQTLSSGYYSSPITIKGATIAKIGQITVHTGDMTDGLHNIVTCPAGVNYIKFDVKSTNTSMSAGSTKTSLQLYYNNTLMATLLTVENNTSLWFTNVYLIEFDSVYDNIIRVGYDKDKIALVAIPRLPTDAETVSFRVNVGTYGNGNFAGNLRHF